MRVTIGDFVAIPNQTFVASYGEIHGDIGPHGAGKTTLLRTLMGVMPPMAAASPLTGPT